MCKDQRPYILVGSEPTITWLQDRLDDLFAQNFFSFLLREINSSIPLHFARLQTFCALKSHAIIKLGRSGITRQTSQQKKQCPEKKSFWKGDRRSKKMKKVLAFEKKLAFEKNLLSKKTDPFFFHSEFRLNKMTNEFWRTRSRVARFFFKQNTKTGNIYQMIIKYTKWPYKRPNGPTRDQMALKYTNIFHFNTLQISPNWYF
jgi:hypothetical protein